MTKKVICKKIIWSFSFDFFFNLGSALWKERFLEKIPREKTPPDSKPNPIPNLTLILPLTPHGGFFPGGGGGGIFYWHQKELLYERSRAAFHVSLIFKYSLHTMQISKCIKKNEKKKINHFCHGDNKVTMLK